MVTGDNAYSSFNTLIQKILKDVFHKVFKGFNFFIIEVKCRLIDNMRKYFGLETINYDFAREEGFTLHTLGE